MSDLTALIERVGKLREEAEGWRHAHKAAGRQVEALAASIRIAAINDAVALLRTLEQEGRS